MSTATYRDVFAEPRFRGVFVARTVWMAAGTLQILTMSVVVYRATGSPLLGALAFGAGFLPQVVSGLLLGASADRISPRRLILGGYLAEAGVAAVLALLHPPVGLALALIAAVGLLAPLSNGATGRLIADALTGDAYVLGRAAISMSSSGAQLVGLAAGGVAVAALGPRNALLAACAGHVLAALIFRLTVGRRLDPPAVRTDRPGAVPWPPHRRASPARATQRRRRRAATVPLVTTARREEPQAGTAQRPERRAGTVLRESWAGARRLLADRPVRRLLFAQWLPPTFSTGGESLLVPYASTRGWPAATAGLLLAAVPLGMLAGDLLVSRLVQPATRERVVPLLIAVIGAPLTLLAARPAPAVAVGLLVVSGFGLSYLLGLQRPFLEAVPEDGRGQAFTLLSTGMMTLQGIGPLLAGLVAEALGPAPVMALAGGAILLVALIAHKAWATAQRAAA